MEAEPGTADKVICSACHIITAGTPGETCGKQDLRGGATRFKCDGTLQGYADGLIDPKDIPDMKEAMRAEAEIPRAIEAEGDRNLLRDMRTYLAGVVGGSIIGSDAETQAEELIGRITEVIDGGGRNTDSAQVSPP